MHIIRQSIKVTIVLTGKTAEAHVRQSTIGSSNLNYTAATQRLCSSGSNKCKFKQIEQRFMFTTDRMWDRLVR